MGRLKTLKPSVRRLAPRVHCAPDGTPRSYDQRRGSSSERGYNADWDAASLKFRRQHPLCLGCEAVGQVEPATCTDHVEPHRNDPAKMWDRNNWQPACDWHHSVIKQKLERMFDRGAIGVDQLRLDSATAIALTRASRGD